MKFILISLLAFSLPAMAHVTQTTPDPQKQEKTLQQTIQSKIKTGGICNPDQELTLPTFN